MGIALIVLISFSVSVVPTGVVAGLKGHWTLVLSGILLLAPLTWYGAVTLATPESWWARRFYDDEKRARAARAHDRWARVFAE